MEGIRTVLIQKRIEQQMTVTQLSKKANVSVYSIKKFERGENVDIDKICKIAAGLGCRLESTTLLPETLEKYEPYKLPQGVSAGDKHWKWTILGPAKKDKFKHAVVLCECDCENHTLRYVDWGRIAQNKSTSCGCDRKEKIAAAVFVKAFTPQYTGESLAGRIFGNGNLVALNAPPRLHENHWEWLCQCQIHDVPPKYFRITKLENGEIKGCGCHGGSQPKYPTMAGLHLGFVKVLNETRKGKELEYKVRCTVCGREKWVRSSYLRKHIGISCVCAPKKIAGRKIGIYYVLDGKERKNGDSLPELLCEKESGKNVLVSKEFLLRTLSTQLKNKITEREARQ